MPCSGYAPPAYGSPEHAVQQHYAHPAYRSSGDDSDGSLLPKNLNNEMNNDDKSASHTKPSSTKDESVSSILSAPSTHSIEKGANTANQNDGNDQKDATVSSTNQQTLSPEEAKQKNYETLIKMSELAQKLAKEEKVNTQQNPLPSSNAQQNQQNQLPSSNTQKTSDKSTVSGPQPTSMNVGMTGITNQTNRQPLFPNAKPLARWN